MAVVFASDVNALVMGDIQVSSRLGQALNAEIAITELSHEEALQFKVYLAGFDEYKKMDLDFPAGHKFRFQLVNEPGRPPHIHVSSLTPIDDPFVNLLLEISSFSGKFSKSYTFLLDPPAGFQLAVVASESVNVAQRTTQADVKEDSLVKISAEVSKANPHHHRGASVVRHKKLKNSSQTTQLEIGANPTGRTAGSQMKLTMSMSISKYDPSAAASNRDNNDALQEELIAKGKILEDMNVQLAEMKAVINVLHYKLSSANPLPAASAVLAASQVAASEVLTDVGNVTAQATKLPVSVVPPTVQSNSASPMDSGWLNPILALIALILGVSCFLWYRKHQQPNAWQHSPFDDFGDEPPVSASPEITAPKSKTAEVPVVVSSVPAPPAGKEDVIKVPAEMPVSPASALFTFEQPSPMATEKNGALFAGAALGNSADTEHKSESPVPLEYTLLLKANRLFRSGEVKQAEQAFLAAINTNPMNSYGYLALLGIYEKRADVVNFAKLAEQLKGIGDESAFAEACALGRKLDPDNPLYSADHTV